MRMKIWGFWLNFYVLSMITFFTLGIFFLQIILSTPTISFPELWLPLHPFADYVIGSLIRMIQYVLMSTFLSQSRWRCTFQKCTQWLLGGHHILWGGGGLELSAMQSYHLLLWFLFLFYASQDWRPNPVTLAFFPWTKFPALPLYLKTAFLWPFGQLVIFHSSFQPPTIH